MKFLERLRSYLERVERAPEGLPVIRVDVAAHLRHFAKASDALRERTASGRDEWADAKYDEQQIRKVRESLPEFLDEVADRITETLAPTASQEEVTRLINVAINWQLYGGDESSSGSRGLDEEVRQAVEQAHSRLKWRRLRDGWESPSQYAFEIRAVARNQAVRHTLTRGGAAFLELPGIDAVRWLLALESAQSLGSADAWRISSELAVELLAHPRRNIDVEDLADGSWRFSLQTIRRLDAMEVLHYQDPSVRRGETFSYAVLDRARPLLEEVAERRPTPFAVLADALLRDQVAQALDRRRPNAERAFHDSAAASVELQARMVVHEIRNALVPAQIAFSRIDQEIAETRPALLQPQRGRVGAGIQRALTFAHDMLRIATLGAEPSSVFDAATAIRDAIAGVATELNGSLRFMPPARVLSIAGPRTRFVLAVTNLLRNAAQAVAGGTGIVDVSLQEQDDAITVCVDDSGPGVPVEQRRAIFEPGVTLRPGGSGQGLALVWQVIIGEMRGSAKCADSPLGGARFEIVVPMKGAREQ